MRYQKKLRSENCIFEIRRVEKCISRLCPALSKAPHPPFQHPTRVKNT